jgi:mono/diheme cytochrome c family protein/plastocyanin
VKRRELFALLVVAVVVLGIPAVLFAYQAARQQTSSDGIRVINMVARAPEQGGFSPDHLTLKAGETVRLRISSPDVVHGLSIPGLGVNVDEILPGKPVEVTIAPEAPGRYAFACIRWCSADHWRMRGVIEVTPAEAGTGITSAASAPAAPAPTRSAPLYQQLGIDLDKMPPTPQALPAGKPSASAGATLASSAGITLPPRLADPAARRALSPAAAFEILRKDRVNRSLSDSEMWNLVAWAWLKDVAPETLAEAQQLYTRDCAACHGAEGKGDGVAGKNLPGLSKMDPMMPAGPADLTDGSHRLAESDAFLQGKILRGGMGTGMPEFGSLYTDEQLWAMVDKVRGFLFNFNR